jgi:carbonic anhydrase
MALWDELGALNLYNILEVVFHSPSEHTFDNANYDLEMQVIFQNYEIDGLAAVAFFFDIEAGGD